LHGHVGAGERKASGLECLGDRRGKNQAQQHQRHKHKPHRQPLGVQPIRHPSGADPHPPDGKHEQQRLGRTHEGEMFDQEVRELGDGEDEHEIEEQLDEADFALLVPLMAAQQVVSGSH
jgi:hypothetical protein